MKQNWNKFPEFYFCLTYPRVGAEEDGWQPGNINGNIPKIPPEKSLLSLAKVPGKDA